MTTSDPLNTYRASATPAAAPSRLPDVNAQTHPFDQVVYLLDQAAYLNLWASPIPDPTPRPSGPGLEIRSWLHPLESTIQPGRPGFEVSQAVGSNVAAYSGHWLFCPHDYPWSPGQTPPVQEFEAWTPQRFTMLGSRFRFDTGESFEGYGLGQTFPIMVNGQSRLLVGAVGNVMDATGKLNGLAGTFVFNGELTPARGFQGNISCRFADPGGVVRTDRELPPPRSRPDLDRDVTYVVMRGAKKNSSVLTTYGPPPSEDLVSLITPAEMRSAIYRLTDRESLGLKAGLSIGQVIGHLRATVALDILAPPGTAEQPAPFETLNVYRFDDACGETLGTVTAKVVLGEAFGLELPALPDQPAMRYGGIGPIVDGTGLFAGAQGLLAVNSAIGIAPHALSMLNILRIYRDGSSFDTAEDREASEKETETGTGAKVALPAVPNRGMKAKIRKVAKAIARVIAPSLRIYPQDLDGKITASILDATEEIESDDERAILRGHDDRVSAVDFSPDGTRVISSSYDKTLRLWDVATGQTLKIFEGHTKGVFATAFSPDGKIVASGGEDMTVRLWNAETGTQLAELEGHTSFVALVAFSPNGATLASCGVDQTIRLWDVENHQQKLVLKGHQAPVWSVAFSPDGKTLASGSGQIPPVPGATPPPDGHAPPTDNSIRLWQAETGEPLQVLEGHHLVVFSVAFSPDGATLASGSGDRTIKLWDTGSWQPRGQLMGHTGWVVSVAYSPANNAVASASHDETLRVWDARRGTEIATLRGHTNWVDYVSYSPDGGSLVTGSHDETVMLWDAPRILGGGMLEPVADPAPEDRENLE